MAVTHEVGLPLDLSKGTFVDTEYVNGFLQLKVMKISDKGNAIYAESGYWESEVISIKDKIAAFKRISKTSELVNGATYKIFTSSSEDRSAWSTWEEIDYADGTIRSPKNSYAKVRIEIKSTMSDEIVTIDDFTVTGKYNNEFVNSDKGVLELKRVYEYEMDEINDRIFSKAVSRNDFNKISKVTSENSGECYSFLWHEESYKRWINNNWQTVSTTLPTQPIFIDEGMSDLSILNRKQTLITIPIDDNTPQGQPLGNGKVFKEKINLKKFIEINSINVK